MTRFRNRDCLVPRTTARLRSRHFGHLLGFMLGLCSSVVLPSASDAAVGDEHVQVLLSGDPDAAGVAYIDKVYPTHLTDAGRVTCYESSIFSPNVLFRITPGGESLKLTRSSPGLLGVGPSTFEWWDQNPAGNMAMVCPVVGNSRSIFSMIGSSIRPVAATGGQAAGDGTFGDTNRDAFAEVSINANNQIAFVAKTSKSGQGVFLASPTANSFTIQQLVKIGDNSLDGGIFLSFQNRTVVSAPTGPGLVSVAFNASTSGSTATGLFLATASGVSLVKGGGGVGTFSMNNSNQIVFDGSSGIWLGTAAGAAPIIQSNEPAPGGGTIQNPVNPMINDRGDILFSAGISPDNHAAIFLRTADGTIKKIAENGQTIDGGVLQNVVNSYAKPHLNNKGLVMFIADISKSGNQVPGIFLGDGTDLVKLIAVGDSLAGGTAATTSTFFGWNGPLPNVPDFMVGHSSFNDAGQVAYRATMGNGKIGVFLSTPSIHWRSGSSDWSAPESWTFGAVPTAQTNVVIDPNDAAVVSPPAGSTTVRKLTVGNRTDAATLSIPLDASLGTVGGTFVSANGVLTGAGALSGGLTVEGVHARAVRNGGVLSGNLNYLSSGRLQLALNKNDAVCAPANVAALVIESGAAVDIVLNGPGSEVDSTLEFWDNIQTWRLWNAVSVTGQFSLGSVSLDTMGNSLTSGLGEFAIKQTNKAVDLVWTPTQSLPTVTTPTDVLVPLASSNALMTNGTGKALRYRWTRNGKTLAAQTTPTLAFPSVRLADAGNYTVTASNDAGSATSAPATRLGVVDVNLVPQVVATKGTLNLGVSAAAPSGLTFGYEWRLNGVLLVDGPSASGGTISGANSSRLRITKMTDAEEGNYTCTVFMDTLSIETNAAAVHVVMKPTVAVIAVPESRVSTPFNWQLVADEFPSGFVVTGLPSGLTYNRITGLVTGTPNVSGSFKVKVSARNPAGSGLIQEFTLTVSALPDGVAGAYSCLVGRDASVNGQLGGFLTLSVTNSGTFSGTLKNAALTHPLRGRVLASLTANPVATVSIVRRGQVPLALALEFDGSKNQVIGTLGDAVGVAGIDGRRHVWGGKTASGYATAYNCINELPLGSEADVLQPLGAAWQQMTIAAAGTVRGAGRTADGAAYTFSGTLWPDASLPQFVVLYAGKGSVTGLPRCALGSTLAENRISGWAEQFKSGPINSKDRTYSAGIPLLRRNVDGSPWVRPTKTAPIILEWPDVAVGSANANITFAQGGVEAAAQFSSLAQNFRITTRNAAVFAAATSGNPCKVRMTINPSTGVFSGAFNLSDTVSGKVLLRQGNFSGLFLSHQKKGFGYLLLPGLSPTVTTSPILSGRTEVSNSF